MEFGLEKCAKANFTRGKLIHCDNIDTSSDIIRHLEQSDTYKYLGINEGDGI